MNSTTGREFRPMGFQYIRLLADGAHTVFAPSSYDPKHVEAMQDDLMRAKFNVIRVFLGNVQLTDGNNLNVAFLKNMVDFAKRCRQHGIYIIIVADYFPGIERYQHITAKATGVFEGTSRFFFEKSYIEAKKAYLTDLITGLCKLDPAFPKSVFSWEFENEAVIEMSLKPFVTKGIITWNNRAWDLANPYECQQLLDKAIIKYSNELSAHVRKLSPGAQTSLSVFTLRAVARTRIAKMWSDKTPDPRVPFRPLALAQSNLSYVDIHCYGPAPQAYAEDKACCEWPKLLPICKRNKKPVFTGEFGTFTAVHHTEAEAAGAIRWYLLSMIADGFCGAVYWTYDCLEQPDLWHAKMGSGSIYNELAEINQNMQSYLKKIGK
ncbi:MAG: glycoside hydrolase 5 family protein [Armatimonadota bacterium]